MIERERTPGKTPRVHHDFGRRCGSAFPDNRDGPRRAFSLAIEHPFD
jgi:hypothetical protein